MKFILRLLLICSFLAIFVFIVAYARGYRLDFHKKSFTSTGIIAITSSPKAAKVYVNGELRGVTDTSLTLPPGTYIVEIKKDGYMPWSKKFNLKGELVMVADATLFPINASLTPLTNLGIVKIVSIDDTGRLLLFSQQDNIEKDGIHLFDPNLKLISIFPPLKTILAKKSLPPVIDFTKSKVYFSPDYKEGLFEFELPTGSISYLLSFDEENKELLDMTASKDSLLKMWDEEKRLESIKILEALPKLLQPIASDSFHIISFTLDKTKVLYTATHKDTLPLLINPPLISGDQEKETRSLEERKLYVYDIKEDKNFKIELGEELTKEIEAKNLDGNEMARAEHYVMWYPDSRHLVLNESRQIAIVEYDNTNKQIVYAGPHEDNYVDVTQDGKLLILANLNSLINKFPDLYVVGIK